MRAPKDSPNPFPRSYVASSSTSRALEREQRLANRTSERVGALLLLGEFRTTWRIQERISYHVQQANQSQPSRQKNSPPVGPTPPTGGEPRYERRSDRFSRECKFPRAIVRALAGPA